MFEIANISILTAFLAGIVSFLSPCVLPLVPGYLSFVTGKSLEEIDKADMKTRFAVMGHSLNFIFGFTLVFLILGASASNVGQFFQSIRFEANLIAGAIIIIFGLHMMGAFKLALLNRDVRLNLNWAQGKPFGTFILGMAFAFGWTPCIGPILGGILTLGASSGAVGQGTALLFIYSMGLAIPFLLVALFASSLMPRLRKFGQFGRYVHQLAGVVMTLIGLAMMTGTLGQLSTWMLQNFPQLQELVI